MVFLIRSQLLNCGWQRFMNNQGYPVLFLWVILFKYPIFDHLTCWVSSTATYDTERISTRKIIYVFFCGVNTSIVNETVKWHHFLLLWPCLSNYFCVWSLLKYGLWIHEQSIYSLVPSLCVFFFKTSEWNYQMTP
jgi:hypothetical protein